MPTFTLPDLLAFSWFLGAWIAYSIVIEHTAKGRSGLNALMNSYRDEWMERLIARDMRMVDAQEKILVCFLTRFAEILLHVIETIEYFKQ